MITCFTLPTCINNTRQRLFVETKRDLLRKHVNNIRNDNDNGTEMRIYLRLE